MAAPRAARAAEIANALARAYLRVTAQERVEAVKRADASIIAQVAGLRDQLGAADAAVERFRGDNGLVKSSETGLVVTQQLKDLYTQIDAAGADVSRLAARKEQVAKIGPEALIADIVPDALNSPTLVTLRAQYANLAREAASQARTLLPQHPHMIELRAELAETQKQLRAELARIRASVSDNLAQATNNLAKLQAKAQDLTRTKNSSSEAETRLRQLESEAQAIRAVFDASLGRARELEQQGKIETSSSRLLSDATAPARPSKAPLPLSWPRRRCSAPASGWASPFCSTGCRAARRAGGHVRSRRRPTPRRPHHRDAAAPRPFRRRGRVPGPVGRARPAAAEIRSTLRTRLPALVAVVAARGASGLQAMAEPLGQALADLGEDVLLCEGGDPASGLAGRRVVARGAAARAAATADRAEFIVTAVDLDRARASGLDAALSADAIVLAVDLSRVGPSALLEAARSVDPSRRRIVALLVADASAGRRFARPQRRAVGVAA